jgi:hypothetical protein
VTAGNVTLRNHHAVKIRFYHTGGERPVHQRILFVRRETLHVALLMQNFQSLAHTQKLLSVFSFILPQKNATVKKKTLDSLAKSKKL